jgi:hypothetical protein
MMPEAGGPALMIGLSCSVWEYLMEPQTGNPREKEGVLIPPPLVALMASSTFSRG